MEEKLEKKLKNELPQKKYSIDESTVYELLDSPYDNINWEKSYNIYDGGDIEVLIERGEENYQYTDLVYYIVVDKGYLIILDMSIEQAVKDNRVWTFRLIVANDMRAKSVIYCRQ